MSEIGSVTPKDLGSVKSPSSDKPLSSNNPPNDAAIKPAARKASESAESKIAKWFNQAGVSSSRFTRLDTDPRKKLEKREHMKRARKMENLERILERALDFSVDKAVHENIDTDWFFSFINLAENVYSAGMQELWGKIFATEISRPGSFSVRTLKTLQEITQREANTFQVAVSLAARKKGEYSPKILYGYYRKPSLLAMLRLPKTHQLNLAEFGLAYPDLLTLMDAGLIHSSEIESGELRTQNMTEWHINASEIKLVPKQTGLYLNYYKFTPIGAELSKLVNVIPNSPYVDALKKVLAEDFTIT